MNQDHSYKYAIYARKSTESEDKQAQSIGDQVSALTQLAEQLDLEIVEVFREAKSAKEPGRRIFNDFVKFLQDGHANGILVWKLNRLARNPIDGATITWLLQNKTVEVIKTFDRSYRPNDNAVLMSVEFGMANQFVKDLSRDVKRGMHAKARKGHYPAKPPFGYEREFDEIARKKGDLIIPDENVFENLKRAFLSVASGERSASSALKYLTDDLGVRTTSGKTLSRTQFYRALRNPFYYGSYEYPRNSGNWYSGKHTPMISQNTHNLIVRQLSRTSLSQAKNDTKLFFPYKGKLKCGNCGASITAEKKTKHQKNGNTHEYNYYRCTRFVDRSCKEKAIEERNLESCIKALLDRFHFSQAHMAAVRDELNALREEENDTVQREENRIRRSIEQTDRKLENLLDLRLTGDLCVADFSSKRKSLLKEKEKLSIALREARSNQSMKFVRLEETLNWALHRAIAFESADREKRGNIFNSTPSNLFLKGQKLCIEPYPELVPFKTVFNIDDKQLSTFEPVGARVLATKSKKDKPNFNVCTLRDDLRTYLTSSDDDLPHNNCK